MFRLRIGLVLGVGMLILPTLLLGQPTTQPTTRPSTQPAADTLTGLMTAPATRPATRPAWVVSLLDDLADARFARREAATRELTESALADPSVARAVEQAAESHPNDEVRARCLAVMDAVAFERRFGMSRISLSLQDATPLEAVDALRAEIRRTVEAAWPEADETEFSLPAVTHPGQAGDRKVSLELESVSLWDAVTAVGEATGLWPVSHEQGMVFAQHGEVLARLPRGVAEVEMAGRSVGALAGLYSAQRHSNTFVQFVEGEDGAIRDQGGHGGGGLTYTIHLLVEPKIRMASSQPRVILDQVVDERGRDLQRDGVNRHQFYHHGRSSSWLLNANVPLDPVKADEAQQLSRLAGHVELDVADGFERIEFDLAEAFDAVAARVSEAGEDLEDADDVGLDLDLARRAGDLDVRITRVEYPVDRAKMMGMLRGNRLKVEVSKMSMVRVAFELNGGAEFNPHRHPEGWSRVQRITQSLALTDAEGKVWRVQDTDWDVDHQSQTVAATITYMRNEADRGRPASIRLQLPTRTQVLRVPFDFRNIPLPSRD